MSNGHTATRLLQLHRFDTAGPDIESDDGLLRCTYSEHCIRPLLSGSPWRTDGNLSGCCCCPCGTWFLLAASAVPESAFALHPTVKDGLFKLPAVPKLESRDLFLVHVLVERVGTDP